MAVTSLLELTLKPECLEEAPAVIAQVLEATRAFDGSLGVDVVQDVDDPTHVVLVERWESMAHDDAYRAFRATPEGQHALGTIITARRLTRCVPLPGA